MKKDVGAWALLHGSLGPPRTHTSTPVPYSVLVMSCPSSFRPLMGRHLCCVAAAFGLVRGRGIAIVANDALILREGGGSPVMTKRPVPFWWGGCRWHVVLGQRVCCSWAGLNSTSLREVRIWGFGSWDTCPGCWELGPCPQACGRPLRCELKAGSGASDGHNSVTSQF